MNSGTLAIFLILALSGTAHSQGTLSEYTTYIGDANAYAVGRIRTDSAGNTYVAGNRSAGTLSEVFVARLDGTGATRLFSTFGGNGTDVAADMAIDSSGNIYLAGSTTSTVFPLHNAMQPTPGPGFVMKLGPDASQVLFATYFPAPVTALALDAAGNIYLTGSTTSATFPATAGLPANAAGGGTPLISAAYITKISAAGDRIVYSGRMSGQNKPCGCCSSCFLSSRQTGGSAIAVDPAGNAYIAGNSDTTDMPVTAGALLRNGIGAFVAKVNAAGTALSYLTYIGTANFVFSPYNQPGNTVTAIAVDNTGSVYLTGSTADPNFPATAGAYQTAYDGPHTSPPNPPWPPSDAFALKLKPDGSGVSWATYLGGNSVDSATSIALDASGNVWLAGTTSSQDFPNAQGWSQGGDFLAELSATGSTLAYAARYPTGTVAQSLALDASGLIHAAGGAGIVSAIAPPSKPMPRIFGIADSAYGSVGGQMARGELISIYGPHIGPATPASFTPTSAGFVPTSLAGVQVMMADYALPVLYVSDSQINAVAPFSLYGGAAGLTLRVLSNGSATPLFPFAPVSSNPQIFQNPDGTAVAVNQDGTINSADHPAKNGSIVSIWLTGVGTASAFLQDGQIAADALPFACCDVYLGPTQVSEGIVYSGSAPGAVNGVVQINFQLPQANYVASEVYPVAVTVSVGGRASSAAVIYAAE